MLSSDFLVYCEWVLVVCLPYEFDSIGWGSHPGCKCKGSKRRPTAEPEPESQKGEDRSILRHKKEKKVPQKQE